MIERKTDNVQSKALLENPPIEIKERPLVGQIENIHGLFESLRVATLRGIPFRLGETGVTLGTEQLNHLVETFRDSSGNLPLRQMEQRVASLTRKLPKNMHPLARLLGGKLLSSRLVARKPHAYPVALELLEQLPRAAVTPEALIPQPAPKGEILKSKQLEDAWETIALSERKEGSVARQLLDSLGLAFRGLSVRIDRGETDIEYDFTLPSSFLSIIRTLKYEESEPIFKAWLLQKLSSIEANSAMEFVTALANFTTLLDQPTHLKLFQAPSVPGQKEPQILLQPFLCLRNSLISVRQELQRNSPGQPILKEIERAEKLVETRYSQVYSNLYRTTLYTVGAEALIPTSNAFATLAQSMIEVSRGNGKHPEEIGLALIQLAESLGVENLEPLRIQLAASWPEVNSALTVAGQRFGLIPDLEPGVKARRTLRTIPIKEVTGVNFAEIIDEKTTELRVYVVTGTFGMFTKGHWDLFQKLHEHLHQTQDEERKSIILIVPVTDTSKIPLYEKDAAKIGALNQRLGVMLLQLAGFENVYFTIHHQPDPTKVTHLAARVFHTVRSMEGQIFSDLEAVNRASGFETRMCFVYGSDEINWEGSGETRKIAARQRQPRKIQQEGGILITRWGSIGEVIDNWPDIRGNTGIDTVILVAGTPYTSSTEAILEIAAKGETKSVMPAANEYLPHWSPKAIKAREKKTGER